MGSAVVLAKKGKRGKNDDSIDFLIDETDSFVSFAAENNKNYATAAEFVSRHDNWAKNHRKVKILNKKNKNVKFGDNFTSDLTTEEFGEMLGLNASDLAESDRRNLHADHETEEGRRHLQASKVNWVTEGKVGAV